MDAARARRCDPHPHAMHLGSGRRTACGVRDAYGKAAASRSRFALARSSMPRVRGSSRSCKSFPGVRVDGSVRLVKGSHIVVPRLFAGKHAFMLQNPDGRIVFAIPYEQKWTLVGTTDVPFAGDPAHVRISDDEIRYLCDTINRYFQRPIAPERRALDVRRRAAAVRRRIEERLARHARLSTRAHAVAGASAAPVDLRRQDHDLSTPRRNGAGETAGPARQQPARWTHRAPLPGGDLPRADISGASSSTCAGAGVSCPITVARRLARAYGTRVERSSATRGRLADLGEHYGAGLTAAEVDYLTRNEWALTRRRHPVAAKQARPAHVAEAERQRLARQHWARDRALAPERHQLPRGIRAVAAGHRSVARRGRHQRAARRDAGRQDDAAAHHGRARSRRRRAASSSTATRRDRRAGARAQRGDGLSAVHQLSVADGLRQHRLAAARRAASAKPRSRRA